MKAKDFLRLLFEDMYNNKLKNTINLNILKNSKYEFNSITHNSSKTNPNSIFCALKGENSHGMQFIEEVEKNQNKLILYEKWEIDKNKVKENVVYIEIDNLREILGELTQHIYGFKEKDKKINIIAVTGTVGKSSITKYIYRLFKLYTKLPIGLISGTEVIGDTYRANNDLTTPEATDIGFHLNEMLQKDKIRDVIVETSSQGISHNRLTILNGLISLAILSNIGQDHLDYHGSYEEYAKVKVGFINASPLRLVNIRDENFRKYSSLIKTDNLLKININSLSLNYSYLMNTQINSFKFEEKLFYSIDHKRFWSYQLENFLFALATARVYLSCVKQEQIEIHLPKSSEEIEELLKIQGRSEVLKYSGFKITFIIDYAHTPEAIYRALSDAKKIYPKKKLIFLFGCGGERDRYKRSIAGAYAFTLSNITIITDDNPRSENRIDIIVDIMRGIYHNYLDKKQINSLIYIKANRKTAIYSSVRKYREKDCILLVSGRGNERYQVINNQKIPFKDKDIIVASLDENEDFLTPSPI